MFVSPNTTLYQYIYQCMPHVKKKYVGYHGNLFKIAIFKGICDYVCAIEVLSL